MRARLTSSRFVGRVGELAELQLAVREAGSGRAALVLLGGDSGVGKTRLVAELERAVTGDGDQDVLVLRGDGVQETDGELPYAPLLGALRPLLRERHPALAALAPGSRARLAAILPGLETDGGGEERAGPGDQLRLFEALLELIDLLSEAGPLVLILEDMHWADRSTRAFVAFLARSLRQERVCLLLTYRTDELHRRHPLRPLLSELERLDRARRVVLEPFDRRELAEALADILGAEPELGLLERLYARSEGNPLYTEELLAAGLDGRGAAPQSLRDAFLVRIERLSPDAQRLARAIAVGRTLDEAALEAVTGLGREAVQGALREAVSEQTVVTCGDQRFGFRHALLREAVYDDLLPGERGELHIALARHLERGGGEPDRDGAGELERSAAIAGHYAAAGDQPAALRSMIDAARAAERVMAHGEAADLAERALELWPRVPDPRRIAEIDHVELLARAARAHQLADDRARSDVLLSRALDELGEDGDRARYAGLLARRSRILWSLNRGPEAMAAAARALALLPAEDPDRIRPLVLAWMARVGFLRGRFRQAVADGEVALAAAVASGNRFAETEVLNTLGMARVALQDVDGGVALLRRAIALARETGDVDSLTTAYSNLADMLSIAGRTGEALATARDGLSQTPRHYVRSRNWITLTLSEMSFEAGDWASARQHLSLSSTRLAGILFIFRQLREAELELGVGDEDGAARCLESVSGLVEVASEPQWIGLFGALAGELAARRGDLDGARAAVQNALDRMELCTDDVIRIARVSAVAVRIEADRAQRARDLRLASERRDALLRARIHVDRLAAAAQEGGPVESAHLAQGRAELAGARGRAAGRDWARAASAWEAIGRPYRQAVAQWRGAEALVAAAKRPEAAGAAGAALQTARALGSRWLVGEISGLAERARLDLAIAVADGGGGGGSDPMPAVAADPFGLTPRERQVLALLAEGATNRQIGASLYMAEKTASVHVSRILAKLGVQGRTQAAAVAHRLHLTALRR
ncbi:MAG: ATP-binding protein [Solirubrobacteraceae bacterium]